MENCIICGSKKWKIDKYSTRFLGLPKDISVIQCKTCTLRRLSPNYSIDQYRNIYEEHYFQDIPEIYEDLALKRVPHFEQRVKNVIKLIRSNEFAMLDIGAASGEFVHEARKAGINTVGIELSKYACDKAREKYGIDLVQGDALTIALDHEAYDVVHMNHVLEHIVNPHEILTKIHSSLKKGGYLVVEIPYQFGSILERSCEIFNLTRPIHFSIYSIHHPYFYTPKALEILLSLHGYSIENIFSWKEYFIEKKIEAKSYCKCTYFCFLELWLRAFHVILQERGKYNFIVAYARK